MVQFASRMDLLKGSEIRELLKLTAQPDIISFAGGMPAPELEAAVASTADLYEQGQGKSAKLTLKVRNNSNAPIRRTLKIRGIEVYFNRVLWEKPFTLDLAPGEIRAIPFDAPLDTCGGVRAEIENIPGRACRCRA